MAAAGIIPVFGWGAKVAKAGVVAYKVTKGLNAEDHALDAKAMDILKQTEVGLYGLTAANGLGEAVTGKDMFGNKLTEEQRQTSLMTALGITGIAGAAKAADKMASGTKLIPYSKEYVQNKVQKAQGSIKDMGKAIGKVEVPTGVKVRTVADTTGNTYKSIGVDKTSIKDLAQKITAKGEGSKGAGKGKSGEKSSLAPGGGLAAHEVKAGHLIERHVGKTDEELLERIRKNPRINRSSTFKDRAIAEKVVSTALSEINNKNAIKSWMSNSQSKSNLVLTYEGTEVIGRGVKRGSTTVENMPNARIILKKDGEGNYILTGYPN